MTFEQVHAVRRDEQAPHYTTLHEFLVGVIRESGRSQRELAEAAGITEKHLSYIMCGRAEGTLNLWSRLLAAADVRLGRRSTRPGQERTP